MTTPSRQVNAAGVDVAALAREIETWLTADPSHSIRVLADHSGIHERGIWQIRNARRPACSLDWADRLCLAMDVDLDRVAPLDAHPSPARRSGKPVGKHLLHISEPDLQLAHDLHRRGVPLRRIARSWQQAGRTTYASENAAVTSMYTAFELRGWPRHDRIEMVRRVSLKHGRAGRAQAREYGPDYAAYRRQQRKRSGYLRDVRCAARNKDGGPCRRWALAGKQHCVAHDPERQAERQRVLEAAWAASRARMLRWGDLRPQVEAAIAKHGRPALVRTSGMATTVIGRMLRYGDEQPVKPETWSKLREGIERLESGRSTGARPREPAPGVR